MSRESHNALQRGRAQLSAESVRLGLLDADPLRALQRGRAQLSAERRFLPPCMATQPPLQRGRAQLSAESRPGIGPHDV